jgi:hypothetical protein
MNEAKNKDHFDSLQTGASLRTPRSFAGNCGRKHLVDFLVGLKQVQMAALQSATLPITSPQPTSN